MIDVPFIYTGFWDTTLLTFTTTQFLDYPDTLHPQIHNYFPLQQHCLSFKLSLITIYVSLKIRDRVGCEPFLLRWQGEWQGCVLTWAEMLERDYYMTMECEHKVIYLGE